MPKVGIHNVRNALGAIAVSQYTDVEIECAVHAISKYKPPAMRQHVTKAGDITIIDDTYNASPDSVKGAVDILSSYGKGSRKIAVLGDMKELGEMSYTGHYEVGKYAKVKEIDTVIAVGEEARNICEGYGEENSYCFDSNEEALEFLKEYIVSDDKILIKGSRSMHMEDIVKGVSDWKKKGCK